MLKAHRNLVKIVAEGLSSIFGEGRYADTVVERLLTSDSRLGSTDRRFIAETVYDMVRYWRHLEILEVAAGLKPGTATYFQKAMLWVLTKGYDLSTWEEAVNFSADVLIDSLTNTSIPRAVKQSVPDWLDTLGMEQLPDRWPLELDGLNNTAPTYIRANTLKTDAESLLQDLKTEGVTAYLVDGVPTALQMEGKNKLIRLGSFRKGLFEVQDASSQLIAPYLDAQPGETIIDACAGAGGKALHLAAIMQNKGRIISMDIEAWKLDELRRRASRNNARIIETQVITNRKSIKKLQDTADRLLLDVPCSGLGILRRNPDTKWKLTPEKLEEVKQVQTTILQQYTKMLKKNGTVVYATCSLMPDENEEQIDRFLADNRDFKLLRQHRSWPSEGRDGFFMAAMQRIK